MGKLGWPGDGLIEDALLNAAIVAYARPFKSSYNQDIAAKYIKLPSNFFTGEDAAMQKLVLKLRNEAVAHSDPAHRPVERRWTEKHGQLATITHFSARVAGIDPQRLMKMAQRLEKQGSTEMARIKGLLFVEK